LAIEGAPAGSRLHAVADEGVPFRTLAETIGRGVGVPVARIEDADLLEHFAFLALLVGLDNPTSATRTRELLGWEPTGPDLVTDLAANYLG
jgi:nucleoside-diphosphate-sugar epimerase